MKAPLAQCIRNAGVDKTLPAGVGSTGGPPRRAAVLNELNTKNKTPESATPYTACFPMRRLHQRAHFGKVEVPRCFPTVVAPQSSILVLHDGLRSIRPL